MAIFTEAQRAVLHEASAGAHGEWDRPLMRDYAKKLQPLANAMMQQFDPRVKFAGRAISEIIDSLSGDSSSPKNLRKDIASFIDHMGTQK